MTTKRLVTNAMLAAVYVVLSNYVALPLGPMKLTLDGLPIVLAALLFGPVDGLLVGLIGNLLSQLLGPYGVSATTFLWAIPDGVRGLLVGLYGRLRGPELKRTGLGVLFVVTALVVTGLTTAVMYVDCLVYRYSFLTYSPYILWRVLAGILVAAVFTAVVPPLLTLLRRALGRARTA